MNARERYRETLLFGTPDKVPFSPGGPRESTRARWEKEGLADATKYMGELYKILGFKPEPGTHPHATPGVSFQMIPKFEEKVLEHKDGHYIVRDWMGAITEISDEYDYTYIRSAKDFVTRKWHKFPVESEEDWEEMKRRFDVNAAGRFPDDFDERCRILADRKRDYMASIHFNGPFWQLREWCGMEGLCILMADQPEFVQEMCEFWGRFVLKTMEPILDKAGLDQVAISEDMAYKAHSMISPAMARKFLKPCYDLWVPAIRAADCPIVNMDSDGYIGELIPIWIESGINVCHPIEVAAHNDIVEFRRQFGKTMGYTGGIDKRAIAKGGAVIEEEMERVIPPLLKDGGFIPGCDHGVPHDISWPNFIDYARILARMTGWI